MLASKFVETELNACIKDQRLTDSPLMVKLITRAIEAYEEYKRLVSVEEKKTFVTARCPECYRKIGIKVEGWDVIT